MSKMDMKASDAVRDIIEELGLPVNQVNLFAAAFNRIVNLEAKVAELQSCIISLTAGQGKRDE